MRIPKCIPGWLYDDLRDEQRVGRMLRLCRLIVTAIGRQDWVAYRRYNAERNRLYRSLGQRGRGAFIERSKAEIRRRRVDAQPVLVGSP